MFQNMPTKAHKYQKRPKISKMSKYVKIFDNISKHDEMKQKNQFVPNVPIFQSLFKTRKKNLPDFCPKLLHKPGICCDKAAILSFFEIVPAALMLS